MAAPPVWKYGIPWPPGTADVEIEMAMLHRGGRFKMQGKVVGDGWMSHWLRMQKLLWPRLDQHRWGILLQTNFCEHRMTGVMGPASSGKTHEAAKFVLCQYYLHPNETTVICSSTERESLEDRIWGEIKNLHREARQKYDWLPGYPIDSRQRILTDKSKEYAEDGRDFRNGMVGVPCKKGGNFVGLGAYAGRKNKYVILAADEGQFMPRAYVDAISNLNKNRNFKCLVMGNPKEPMDALGAMCEPAADLGGWDGAIDQSGGTKTWRTRWPDGVCVQLVGSDSPNFDVGEKEPIPFPYLIKRSDIATDIAFYGRDSLQFTMMDEGRMPRGAGLRRVITRPMCEKFGAMDQIVWTGSKRTTVAFLDAAYGATGGDRCVFGFLEFGTGLDRENRERQMINLISTEVVPVNALIQALPEDQIAGWVKVQCERRMVPPQQCFFDSTGRGTLMGAFARLWSAYVNPIEFGGRPTERMVSAERRVPCSEYYSKFVSELWYSVRLCIEAGQFRGMTDEVMAEGCLREWTIVTGNRVEVEPKEKTKIRMGRSPDLFDGLVAGVEGARRLGFEIANLANEDREEGQAWIEELADRFRAQRKQKALNYAA